MANINLLSFFAIISASYFLMMLQQRIMSKRDKQNIWTMLVIITLSWWNICDAFFYVAKTKEMAWLWHRLGALGWCGFIAVTGYYFLVLTKTDIKMSRMIKVLYWIVPAALTFCFMFLDVSPMAQDLVQSTSGLGWTFVQRFDTVWPFIFLLYLLLYMGGALLKVYFWEKDLTSQSEKIMAKGFLVLDSIVVVIGFVSIFLLPYFTPMLPPAGCIATLIFGVWYWGWLRDYDFLYVELALNPGVVFENCIDAMLVTDENYKILYANQDVKKLLSDEHPIGCSLFTYLDQNFQEYLKDFRSSASDKAVFSNVEIKDGPPVICSITKSQARRRRFKVYIISLKEISQLKEVQARLDYLAHYDVLTGLVNRHRLGEWLAEWEALYINKNEDFELVFLDLSRFKLINDTFGHVAGDRALMAVADALREVGGADDVIARFAGDEFVILHKGNDIRKLISLVKQKVREIDCSTFAPGFVLYIDSGSCKYSEAGSIDNLFKIADKRMYENKKSRA